MTDYDPTSASSYTEHRREIAQTSAERFSLTEVVQSCVDLCFENQDLVITDVAYFNDIPFHNNRRTLDELFIFKDTRFSHLNIRLPRKDPQPKIRIEGRDAIHPNRVVRIEEILAEHPKLKGLCFVDDTASDHMPENRKLDSTVESAQIADWLMNQAGLTEDERKRKLMVESDPLQYAATMLSVRAGQHLDVKQASIPLRPDLEFYTEVIEEIDINDPTAPPMNRIYRAWINQFHEIDGHMIKEQTVVQFSPDDPLMALDRSELTTVSVNVESDNPRIDAQLAAAREAILLEQDGVHELFSKVYELLETATRIAKLPKR